MPRYHHEPLSESEDSPNTESYPTNYNIYLNKSDIKNMNKTSPNADHNQVYMCLIHDKMRQDYDKLKLDLSKSVATIAELSSECDQLEKTTINLKGILQNINGLNIINKQLIRQHSSLETDSYINAIAVYKENYKLMKNNFTLPISVVVAYILVYYMNLINMFDVMGNLSTIMPILIIHMMRVQVPYWVSRTPMSDMDINNTPYHKTFVKYTDAITTLRLKINEIEKSTDFLSDLINES